MKEVERFAILVMSDTLGSIIKEAEPPKVSAQDSATTSEGGYAQGKADRIISRVNECKNKKK